MTMTMTMTMTMLATAAITSLARIPAASGYDTDTEELKPRLLEADDPPRTEVRDHSHSHEMDRLARRQSRRNKNNQRGSNADAASDNQNTKPDEPLAEKLRRVQERHAEAMEERERKLREESEAAEDREFEENNEHVRERFRHDHERRLLQSSSSSSSEKRKIGEERRLEERRLEEQMRELKRNIEDARREQRAERQEYRQYLMRERARQSSSIDVDADENLTDDEKFAIKLRNLGERHAKAMEGRRQRRRGLNRNVAPGEENDNDNDNDNTAAEDEKFEAELRTIQEQIMFAKLPPGPPSMEQHRYGAREERTGGGSKEL